MRHLLLITIGFLLLISSAMSMQRGAVSGLVPDSTDAPDTLRRVAPPNGMQLHINAGPAFSTRGYGGLFGWVAGYSSSLGLIGVGATIGGELDSWKESPAGSMKLHANMRFVYGQHWRTSGAAHTLALGVGGFGVAFRTDGNGGLDTFRTTILTADYFYYPKLWSISPGLHLFAGLTADRDLYAGVGGALQFYSEDRHQPPDTLTDSVSVTMHRLRGSRFSPGTLYRRIFGEDADQRLGVEWINREEGGVRLYYGIVVNDYLVVSPGTVAIVRSSQDGGVKASINLIVPGYFYAMGFLLGGPDLQVIAATLFALPNAVLNPTLRLPLVRKHLWLVAQQRSDAFINTDDNWVFLTETAVGAHLSLWRATLDARYVVPWNTFHIYNERRPYFSLGIYLGGV
jgi:hypothetical protein